jgi:rod shape determining protein RodA
VLIWRALRIATLSRDMYGSILAGGIGAVILFQVFVNIGMAIGIMPVTGIPLPFVSYGGTHMIAFLMLVGLLQAIHVRATIAPTKGGRFAQ